MKTRTALLLLALSTTATAQTRIDTQYGTGAGNQASPVIAGYDLDGDLVPDYVVGEPYDDTSFLDAGSVSAYSGKTGALLWKRNGGIEGAWYGFSLVWAGDLNGDLRQDVMVGAPYQGSIPNHKPGKVEFLDGVTGALHSWKWGNDHLEGFGYSVASNFSWKSSGSHLAVGAPFDDDGGSNAGSVVIYEKYTGNFEAILFGDSPGDQLGRAMSMVRDTENDGRFNLAVGAPYADYSFFPFTFLDAGMVRVYSSTNGSTLQTYYGSADGEHLGSAISPLDDIDSDGQDDFAVGGPGYDGAGTDSGRVRILGGNTNITLGTIYGSGFLDQFGSSMCWLPDLDGDNRYDLAVGAPQFVTSKGYVMVLSGFDQQVLFTLTGSASGDRFGAHLYRAGDINKDGIQDLAVGAPGDDLAGQSSVGSVSLFSAGCPGFVNYCTAGISASGCQASIVGAGVPSASAIGGFSLIATGVEGDKDGLFFFGPNGRQAVPWGNGTSYQCVVPPVKRGGLLIGTGTPGLCDGVFSQDMNLRWTLKPKQNFGAGAIVQAQLWHRDPQNTSNRTTTLSDAVEFAMCP